MNVYLFYVQVQKQTSVIRTLGVPTVKGLKYAAVEMDIRVTEPPAHVKTILYVSISFIDISHK